MDGGKLTLDTVYWEAVASSQGSGQQEAGQKLAIRWAVRQGLPSISHVARSCIARVRMHDYYRQPLQQLKRNAPYNHQSALGCYTAQSKNGQVLQSDQLRSVTPCPDTVAVLVPQGKNCKFCRDYFVFYPCPPAERYNADPGKVTILSLMDEYSWQYSHFSDRISRYRVLSKKYS
jgi:hypothetical protein